MGHVLAQSMALEGLENEKKVLRSATEAQKNVPDGHLRPRPRTKFIPEGNFFVVITVLGQKEASPRAMEKRRSLSSVLTFFLT